MPADVGKPNFPSGVPLDVDNFNRWVVNAISNLQSAFIPPTTVTNLRVTPQPGGNLIDFTRSDGESYTLYINTTGSVNLATHVQLGTANRYTHSVGKAGILYYYAVQAFKGSLAGEVSPWISGTTLGLAVPAAQPDPPPATEFPFVDQETDAVAVTVPDGVDFLPL